MDSIVVRGGNRLHGKVQISGAKNAALPILASSLLTQGRSVYRNVPELADINTTGKLLRSMGCGFERGADGNRDRIDVVVPDPAELEPIAPYELVKTMRASVLVLGPLVARYGKARVSLPGGCAIGARPIDQHLKGLEALGASISLEHGYVQARAPRLRGARFAFDVVTVTGTENLLMAATLARGTTTIVNASSEPEISFLGSILRDMGARITGVGTPHIRVHGVDRLRGYRAAILPDRIEAGTFAIAAAITDGEVILDNVSEPDMLPLTYKLREAGAEVWWNQTSMLVRGRGELHSTEIQALPFPGFPTDLQAAFAVLMTQAKGQSRIFERVFNDRLRYAAELAKLGADITVIDKQQAIINGPTRLRGADVEALDIRSGACLVLAGLVAEGETRIGQIQHLRRGYEDIVEKFASLGAEISYL